MGAYYIKYVFFESYKYDFRGGIVFHLFLFLQKKRLQTS